MTRIADYRALLRSLPPEQWEPILRRECGLPAMERWFASTDRDVRWVMRVNLRKERLARVAPEWTVRWQAVLAV